MNNKKNIRYLVCLLLVVLDVTAAILGIEAEIAENKVRNLRVWIIECKDPSYQAFKLALAAAILLSLAHIAAIFLSGCICIWSKQELEVSSNNKQLAAAAHVLSWYSCKNSLWIIYSIAFLMLMSGALKNNRPRQNCGMSHNRLLSIGGVLCFLHGLFAVGYYVAATATIQEEHNHPAIPTAGA